MNISSSTVRTAVLAAVLLLLGLIAQPITAAASTRPAHQTTAVQVVPAVDSPSPTLGATEQSNPVRPGDNDGDPNDYSGAPWIVIGMVAVAIILIGGTLYFFRGRNRRQLSP